MKKLYRGKKRIAYKCMSAKWKARVRWALSLKPGDYIATCEGCNRQIKEIKIEWHNVGRQISITGKANNHWYIGDVEFIDTNGRYHYLSGLGCVDKKETPEEVTTYLKSCTGTMTQYYSDEEKSHPHYQKWAAMEKALLEGLTVVDEYGQLLPEYDFARS